MTIGDVLAVIALIFTIAASWAAMLLVFALAFPYRTSIAQQKITTVPGRCFWRGVVVALVVGALAALLNASHAGPVRIVSGALLTGLGILAAVGSAGIIRLIGERIRDTGTQMPEFATLTRGTVLFVTAVFLPIFGWFLVLPVSALISIGAGVAALASPPSLLPLKVVPNAPELKNGNGSSAETVIPGPPPVASSAPGEPAL